MSADNYNLVHRRPDGRWQVWLNLSAPAPFGGRVDCDREPDRVFDTCVEAVEWADAQGYTEYGTEIDDGTEVCATCLQALPWGKSCGYCEQSALDSVHP